ncbi:hypothetical protein HNR46_000143 [Haloferula luteola]|uniref:Retropepsin-like aspartic endopeptidase domain-containing protein n=1 Tax=Haloferula luteola TaxID=595692 RepID=A0A840UVW3_9BACT|nr:RimK/LysX family protein [Haloferula luteola]MBB5349922.1 hypothetical protein [Haloferula luteola]
MKAPTVIGWREWVELPEWGLVLRAKADTGAKSSAIDCASIERIDDDHVRFVLRLDRKGKKMLTLDGRIAATKVVRSSTGIGQERHFVETTMVLAGRRKTIQVSLVCRKRMIHRMLLGRTALGPEFLVDSSVDHWATPRKAKSSR